ncbi:MarR family transcriptional regulator [Vibrio sp. SM6]|uniref:MarR family transcriptional regulator n=1 Tax=Vibrio agarilyticus TaxID=2726741 RepID=A0A7X8TQ70_9VIBR|nr:MarR family transcriptional regulator [Vibrio agarilyticus]NLS12719.1 MarR family transcriptional regulator [Vibrio agarilyticus]
MSVINIDKSDALPLQLAQLERISAKVWRKHNKEDPLAQLSFNEYDYLKVLQMAQAPIRLTDLAVEMEVSKPSVTNMVQRLERRGLAQRIACEYDARSKRVVLTDLARQHLALEEGIYQSIADDLCRELSGEEQYQLTALLSKALCSG